MLQPRIDENVKIKISKWLFNFEHVTTTVVQSPAHKQNTQYPVIVHLNASDWLFGL